MADIETLRELPVQLPPRRSLLQKLAFSAAAVGAGVALPVLGSRPAKAASGPTIVDVFNFALNLEYLEAEYYLRAVTGSGIPAADGGVTANVIAPASTVVPFQTSAVAYFAQAIAAHELQHVRFIRAVLTELGQPIAPEPQIDLVNSFAALGAAAGLGPGFDPFADEIRFLVGAYVFEDVGVTAYAGAAASGLFNVTDPSGVAQAGLAYAASILAVEAYHASAIRTYLSIIGGDEATNAISAVRAAVSGVGDNGTGVTGNPYNFANVDIEAQAYRRTPPQVLNVVFATPGTGVTKGGFLPNGTTGTAFSST